MDSSRYLAALLIGLCLSSERLLAQSYDELIAQSMQLRNAGQFAEAETLLRQAHQAASDQRESYYLLAMTIAFQQRFGEAQQLLEQAIARYPDDLTLKISYARVLSFQNDYARAQQTVDEVLDQHPDNTEAINLSGRLALYQNQAAPAIQRYTATLEIDPRNLEALIGMHDAYTNLGADAQAAVWLERAAAIDPDHADVRARQGSQLGPEPGWQVIYGYGNSHFERIPLSDWYDSFVEAHREDGYGNDIYARAEHLGHFGMADTLLAIGTVRNMDGFMPWGAKLEYSPDAVFVPDYRINLFVAPRIREGGNQWGPTVATLSAQHASYPSAQVSQLGLSLDQYLFNGRVWLTPSFSTVLDENNDTLTGWNLRANMLLDENLLMGMGYGESPQTENATTASTRTAHVYGQATLTDDLDLRIDWVREDREGSYVRYGTTFALIWKY